MELNKIYHGDCLDIMRNIPDCFVDLTVTSPPYDNLRDYKGYVFDFHKIANQLFRVTKKGGVLVWVVADSTIKGSETGNSFKQALYFKEIGFNLHDTMIFAKNNPMPLTHNRYEQQFEYMFVLSKGKPSIFNPIKEETKNKGIIKNWKNCNDYGKNSAKRSREEMTAVKEEKIKNNIWFYNVGNYKVTNSGPFPYDLAKDHIITWSNEGDLILDPMCGSGTTLLAAKDSNRNYWGIDISKEYCLLSEKRLGD